MRNLFQYISCYSLSAYRSFENEVVLLFQYISCYSLSNSTERHEARYQVSIHLILLFILEAMVGIYLNTFVSIHLMLLFIFFWTGYPHVQGNVSIHLMLLFILEGVQISMDDSLFQYISCYSLSRAVDIMETASVVSIHLMLLFINMLRCSRGIKRRFNTSHVTLYRGTGKKDGGLFTTFQYISCYSLSVIYSSRSKAKNVVSIHLMLLFIILVGSSLSMKKCFNTSHVTLYLTFQLEVEYIHTSFNTSHVTLYL